MQSWLHQVYRQSCFMTPCWPFSTSSACDRGAGSVRMKSDSGFMAVVMRCNGHQTTSHVAPSTVPFNCDFAVEPEQKLFKGWGHTIKAHNTGDFLENSGGLIHGAFCSLIKNQKVMIISFVCLCLSPEVSTEPEQCVLSGLQVR